MLCVHGAKVNETAYIHDTPHGRRLRVVAWRSGCRGCARCLVDVLPLVAGGDSRRRWCGTRTRTGTGTRTRTDTRCFAWRCPGPRATLRGG